MATNEEKLLFRHITEYLLPQLGEDAFVYHYTSPLGMKSILENRELWASDFAFLNDKSEHRYVYEVLSATIADKNVRKSLNYRFLEEVNNLSDLKKVEIDNGYYRYVCSFSQNPDALSLWNYYTKTATGIGYNIGFAWKDLVKGVSKSFEIQTGKVLYDPNEQKRILTYALLGYNQKYIDAVIDEKRAQVLTEFKYCLSLLSAYFKHPAFIVEEEVRICIVQKELHSNPRKAKYRESGGLFVPYLTIKFPADVVKFIGISPINDDMLSVTGVKSLLLDYGYSEASIKPSHIPLRN